MKCTFCNKPMHEGQPMILITVDGDFVCSDDCKDGWENARDNFMNEIIHDDAKFNNWLIGND